MRFSFTQVQQEWRGAIRDFLATGLTPSHRLAESMGDWRTEWEFAQRLGKRGWLAAHWPVEHGGRALSFVDQAIFAEEMGYAGAPLAMSRVGTTVVGPAIILAGSESQRAKHLPRIAQAGEIWCQAFSERGAGSDLAALETTAVRSGDAFIVNGTKVWTSYAAEANFCLLAARTDPDAPKHRGITLFIGDMSTPGIEVRPLPNLSGHLFSEVTFRDVAVPAENMLGEVNQGWQGIVATLSFERSGIHRVAAARRMLDETIASVGGPLANDVGQGDLIALAALRVEIEIGRLLAFRVVAMQDRGMIPDHEASIAKMFASELEQRAARVSGKVLGLGLQAARSGVESPGWHAYLETSAVTVRGGTSEIQRNIIATRGLGLAR